MIFFRDGKVILSEVSIMVLLYAIYVFIVSQRSKRLNYNVDQSDGIVQEVEKEVKTHPIKKIMHKALSFIIPNPEKYPWLTFLMSVGVMA
ncbi:hypothetical protein KKG31_01135 [Patescibacteria group bacterium]|nr:hypothetical protein [Patescibacteria group bacterium]MBU1757783.1 hypothetical protein [Patescibacteria group bacterium]